MNDVLMEEGLQQIRICESIIALQDIEVSLADARDIVRLVSQPSKLIVGNDDLVAT